VKVFLFDLYKYFIYSREYFKNSVLNIKSINKNVILIQPKNIKFAFIDSSQTWYGIARQLSRVLVNLGCEPTPVGIKICYANDLGEINPYSLEEISPQNRATLMKTVNSQADIVFYSQKICGKWFQDRTNSFYLPAAANTDIFKTYPEINRKIDVGFVGRKYDTPIRKKFLQKLQAKNNKFSFIQPEEGILFFENLAKFYNRCKIVVNDSQANEINMRMFEATACGSLLITRQVPFIEELFEPGKEIITYKDFNEMVEKIGYYLKNERERKIIAQRGRKKTNIVHSYYDRARFICNKIKGERKAEFMINSQSYTKLYKNYARCPGKII